ncbi:MAG: phosphatase PAP2 family protein [Acidimicrobiales bacterium]
MWLPWEYGLVLAVCFGVASWRARPERSTLAAFTGEAAIVSVLYSLWQLAGRISLLGIDEAIDRGAQLWQLERALRLPNELDWQNALLPHSFWTQVANIYYAGAHVPAMGIFLVWLFARHRPGYSKWRNTLALITAACLLIQLLPVAPPRLTAETGMIDSGLAYGQSVYGALGRGIAGQLQAMPSIHVAWAALIGWATVAESTSRWRWLGPIHFLITFVVVAVTGNHYWLDGLAAMVLLVPARRAGQWIADGASELRIDHDVVDAKEQVTASA